MDPADRRLLADLGALVAIPSVSSVSPKWDMPNRPVIDFLASRLEAAGFAVRIDELPHAAGKANLIATLGRGDGGLVLAGHTDTVPCDAQLWQSDPYRLDVRGEQLHGLGTTDMKGFLAIVLSACAQAREWRLRAPLVILATADEESTMAGARALTAGGLSGRYAVIGEPTGLRAVRRHKGVLMQRIRVTGRSGHSSDPALGRNALDGMHRVLGTLIEWRKQLSRGPLDDAFAVPYTSLNLGRIAGGDNPNRICGECELDIDLRPLPGTTREALRSELDQRLSTSLQGLDLG
jgi:acetylornithine deacetylase